MTCSICQRPNVQEINAVLRSIGQPGAESLNGISRRLTLPKSSLSRHKNICLTQDQASVPGTVEQRATDPGNASEQQGTPEKHHRSPYVAIPNPGDDAFTAPRKFITAEIEQRCVDLRMAGKRWSAIGAELGIGEATAADTAERVMIRSRRSTDAKADSMRTLELERLDRLMEALWERATQAPGGDNPNYDAQGKAVDRVLKVMERRAKLLGLDVPTGPSTVNIVNHPAVQPIILNFMSMVRRAIEALHTPAEAERVLLALDDAAQVHEEEGERGFRRWLAERGSIETTGEVVS